MVDSATTTTSKPGKHGTLHLFKVVYRDTCDADNTGVVRLWGYDAEHVRERFHEGDDDGWEIVKISRVPRNN